MISIPFIDASSAMSTAEANKENFIKGNTLICHSKNSEYLVSKKESWNIDADYFKRESLLIRADRCSKR
ncbi:hypothetical protein MNB_SM-4-1691 [hydrothermal vent metagenome]|uniref:Uncharacterized protein n=1 Tax=hydrothermal vent metagenome TaxID=652676 RepID=A0A1W1CRZ3_9ZZZZ